MEKFKTLKDHVYEYIADKISEGSLSPEHKINEQVICESLGISRTPVREALIQLTTEGILENQARKGFVVKAVSEKSVTELYSIIGVLDGLAAVQSLPHITNKDIEDMDFYISAMDLAINKGNYSIYHQQQLKFHNIYIDKSNNATLIELLDKEKRKLLRKSYDNRNDETKKVLLSTNEEHKVILSLFRDKKSEELFKYISTVHWAPSYAKFDVMGK